MYYYSCPEKVLQRTNSITPCTLRFHTHTDIHKIEQKLMKYCLLYIHNILVRLWDKIDSEGDVLRNPLMSSLIKFEEDISLKIMGIIMAGIKEDSSSLLVNWIRDLDH